MGRWENAVQTRDEVFRLKRETVLRESGRIFSRRGFHNTSLTDVAKQLDVSKATLYNYVKDKQELLFEFHNMALNIGAEALDAAERLQGNGAQKLQRAMHDYIAKITEELGGYGVIAELGALTVEDRRNIIQRRDQLDKRFVALINVGMADGSLREVDPKMAVFTFMGALQTIPNWFSPNGRLTGVQVAERVTNLLLTGMASIDLPPKDAEDAAQRASTRKRQAYLPDPGS